MRVKNGILAALTVGISRARAAKREPSGRMALLRRRSGGGRYSGLADITPQNVNRLEVAWQWKHWETPLPQVRHVPGFSSRAHL